MIAYTNVVFTELGDKLNELPEVRPVVVMGYDGDYVQIQVAMKCYEIRRKDLHLSYGSARDTLPSTTEPARRISYDVTK